MRNRLIVNAAILAVALAWGNGGGASAYTYKVIYDFCSERGCADGANPLQGLTIDEAGNIYGATQSYSPTRGTIYELIPVPGKTGWKFRKLAGGKEVSNVNGRMIFDVNGNIYGTSGGGSKGYGAVFELLPDGEHTRRIWKELYSFGQDDPHGTYPNSLTYLGASSGVPYDGVSPLFGTTQQEETLAKKVSLSPSPPMATRGMNQSYTRSVRGIIARTVEILRA